MIEAHKTKIETAQTQPLLLWKIVV